jgi:glucokinase
MTDLVYAADLGGTNLRMAAVDEDGSLLHHVKKPLPKGVSPDELIGVVRDMTAECRDGVGESGQFVAVAFTAPAPVPSDFDGVLTKLPNLPSVTGMNLKTALNDLLSLPVHIENDATAAAIGEHWIGAAQGVDNMICVTLGTGIGGGIIINNEPIRGKDGTGGEIGHMTVVPDGPPCPCGSRGCVERYASATAILAMARESGMQVESSADVYKAWESGSDLAEQVFAKVGYHLGIHFGGLINALNPEMIVIAGGAAASFDAFFPHLDAEVRFRAYPAAAERAKIVRGQLGDDAGILGVARSAYLSMERGRLVLA